MSLIAKLTRLGEQPDVHHGLDHLRDGRPLRDDKDARAGLPRREVGAEMIEHSAAVVRHQNPSFACCAIQKLRVAETIQSGILGGGEVDRRFAPPDGLDDSELEIVVCLEANAQDRGSPWAASALARWIFAHSVGLACSRGIALPSNSRSVFSRYLSIS